MPRSASESYRSSRYFRVLACVLGAIVVAGFSRTFFFRAWFHVPPLYWHIYVHGVVLAGWVALFALQTCLIASGQTRLHRRLGVAGAVLALLVVSVGAFTLLQLPAHFVGGHLSNDTPFDRHSITFVFWQDWADLLTFSILVTGALLLRNNSAAHKRLMLLATIRIVGAGLVRVAALIGSVFAPLATQPVQVLFTTVFIAVVFPSTLIAYDLVTMRRVHRATVAGVAVNIVTGVVAGMIAASAVGQALFTALA